ncbi:MAG: hypothetical protein CL508_06450 [Actinobacteria bacterium]|nr:hypothetical protein [Actinomycetota bacterium]
MTETLNYDPTDPDAPEFSEDEQNSLEVAEKLGQQESELYAGKFENAEELENAYLELQRKLGSDDDDDEVEDTTLDEDEVEYDEATVAGIETIQNASDEYYENEGNLSAETMERFGQMDARDLVNAFMAIQENSDPADSYPDLSDAEMNTVYNSVGGEAEYGKLTSWAAENMDDKALDAFNTIIDQGNPTAIQIAVAGMKAEYDNQEGYEGRMLTGKAARATDGFRSQAEVVAAMSDPRYDRDPAYRQDLYDKLERSNVAF